MPLLNKTLSISSNFIPALADRAVAYFVGRDYESAERSLEELEKVDPTHGTIQQLRQAIATATSKAEQGGAAASSSSGSDVKWKNNRMMKKVPGSAKKQ